MSRDGTEAAAIINAWDLKRVLRERRIPHVYYGPAPSDHGKYRTVSAMFPTAGGKTRTNRTGHDRYDKPYKKGWGSLPEAADVLAEMTGRPSGQMMAAKGRYLTDVYVPQWALDEADPIWRSNDNGRAVKVQWVETIGRCPGDGWKGCDRPVAPGADMCGVHAGALKRRDRNDAVRREKAEARDARNQRTRESQRRAEEILAELAPTLTELGHRPDTVRVTTAQEGPNRIVGVMLPAETLAALVAAAAEAEELKNL